MSGKARSAQQRKEAKALWTCPVCARKFAKKNQSHSCDARSINTHLRDKDPEVLRIYDLLVKQLSKFGPLRIDAVKTSINFASKHHFGGVILRKNYLRLGFLSAEVIDDERIVRTEKLGPKKVAHFVILRSLQDVDDEVLRWLEKAYALQAR